MAKREQYFDQAEELYVVKQLGFEAIARELGLGEKTVRNWAKGGGWAEKRAALLRKRQGMHELMYETAYLLMQSIRDDLAAGTPVEPGRLYSLKQMVGIIQASLKYERDAGIEPAEPETTPSKELSLSAEKLEQIKQIMNF